ncbi:MAG: histidine kinase [Chitinophagaceae bacterium]|nr:histidine kinase [Chitinophagaceae bacterium]
MNWKAYSKKDIALNILFSAVIMLLPLLDAPTRRPTRLLYLDNPYVFVDFIVHFLCLIAFYANYVYWVPKYYLSNRKLFYFILVLAVFFIITLVPDFIEDNIYTYRERTPDKQQIHILIQVRHIFYLYLSLFFFSLYRIIEQRRVQSEKEKADSEIRFLKAQINPHFLFNTLNSIYALTHTDSKKAGDAIVKMSNLMRYSLNKSDSEILLLRDAVGYIENYIDLQAARFGSTVVLDTEINITGNYKIAPLMLLPFIENAFKYGIFPSKPSVISVRLYNEGSQLYFFVSNTNHKNVVQNVESTGIGIINTKKRLAAIYGERHEIKIKETQQFFKVALTIALAD